jgi:hypothetical protein
MTAELKFKRPGRVYIGVDKSAGGYIYAAVRQVSRAHDHHHIASASGPAVDCALWDVGGSWHLDVRGAAFQLTADEARQLQETFGLQVRHIAAKAAS